MVESQRTILDSGIIVKHHALLTVHEILHAVDPSQLENGIAHRSFEQDSEIAPGCHRDHNLAHRNTQYHLRLRIKRKAWGVDLPVPASIDLPAVLLSVLAFALLFRFKLGIVPMLAICSAAGLILGLGGPLLDFA